ncbi:MAG: ABC transporter substrate-binding protein [Actinobacteria bacterium 13_2_20CM_2_71_6]|nr:MAG: ABC transporter substrate-binding protein [Actinobacteria bacterium 13_2_20CM_2_71_6]
MADHATPGRALRFRAAGMMVLALLAGGLVACSDGSGTPVLNWYINPDNGGQDRLAASCTQDSGGRYRIQTSLLPNSASAQREQLVRRLAAKDASISLMSLDPPFIAEAANAGFLRPFPDSEASQFTDGVLAAAVDNAKWGGKLFAAPFWANTQLLWYRKSLVQKAGVDPTSADFTWDKMIDTAVQNGVTIGEQGNKYEGYMVWINALVASAGGQIIADPEKGANASVRINSPAGKQAASIISKLARSVAASPTLSTDTEEQARALFDSSRGGFLLNWPYIWQANISDAGKGVIPKSILDDVGWARYPRVSAGQESKPPFGGIGLAIGAYGPYKDTFALDAAKCITSADNQKKYMLDSGNPAARGAVYDDAEVIKLFPMAALIRDSINAAAPRPITPYYSDVSASVQSTWHPPANVNPDVTPKSTADFIPKVLHDEVLL